MSKVRELDERKASAARVRFDRLYATLLDRICLLDYPPGTRLSEEALAEEFGVSRTPLRRVLGWLESQGLLKSVQGVGTLVTDVNLEELTQVYQLRMELAELLGKLSPIMPDAETLAQFRDIHERSLDLVVHPDARTFARLNMAFFQAHLSLTSNEPLREISERLYIQTSRIWLKLTSEKELPEEIAFFSREIADILAAVEIGDLEAAAYIRRSHISMSFTRLKKLAK